MLWFTFEVIFGTIPGGWVGGGNKVKIRLTQSSWAGAGTELGNMWLKSCKVEMRGKLRGNLVCGSAQPSLFPHFLATFLVVLRLCQIHSFEAFLILCILIFYWIHNFELVFCKSLCPVMVWVKLISCRLWVSSFTLISLFTYSSIILIFASNILISDLRLT